jgi:nanoRNase/pAp phosphatase (c-di-AMP/oligoRNAs hydrolase)
LEKKKKPEKILYETKLGELIRIFSFLLKGRASEVNKLVAILGSINSPYEILNQETAKGKFLFKRSEKVGRSFYDLLEKALSQVGKEKLFVFTYPSSKMSFTADLSNELLYRYPNKLIIVAREKDGEMRLSFRSGKMKVRPILEKALVGVRGYGGGHLYACGGNIKQSDFNKFIDNIKKQIKEV